MKNVNLGEWPCYLCECMKILTLKRIALRADGTFGVLCDEGNEPFCLTLERPWLDNKKNESCIPKGEYRAIRAFYKSKYDSFLLQNVPNRDGIFIHKGNWASDSLGCIILGEQFAVMLNPHDNMKAENSVASTGEAHSEFMERLKGQNEFTLVITEV